MKSKLSECYHLFIIFFKIGLFTIGGGYAMLPILESEIVTKLKWATHDELLDYYAIGQTTPGIIAINTATFIGVKRQGVLGGLVATLGMVVPSWIIITLIASFLETYASLPFVVKAFSGIRIGVAVLILQALMTMAKKGLKGTLAWFILLGAFIGLIILKLSPIPILVTSALLGIAASTFKKEGNND